MMEVKKIWFNDNIRLVQICSEDFCINAVLINNDIVKLSTDWDTIVSFLDRMVN